MFTCHIKRLLIGFVIGIAMLVPGVSGGTIAAVFGIYETLLSAANGIFHDFKHNFILLFEYAVGGLIGFFSMANVVSALLEKAYQPMMYLFIGLIVSGTYLLYKGMPKEFRFSIPGFLIGILVVVGFGVMPKDMMLLPGNITARLVMLLISGILLAAALILPGISFSLMLVILGIYSDFIEALKTFDFSFLIPLGLCTAFGTICLIKILSYLMIHRFSFCQSMIIGFVLASLRDLYPGIPQGMQLPLCLILLIVGITAPLLLSTVNKKANA